MAALFALSVYPIGGGPPTGGGPAFSLGDLQAGAKGLQQVDDVPKKAEGKGDGEQDAAKPSTTAFLATACVRPECW